MLPIGVHVKCRTSRPPITLPNRTQMGLQHSRLRSPRTRPLEHRAHVAIPSILLPPERVKVLPGLEYVAGRCSDLEYVLMVHATGPRKK